MRRTKEFAITVLAEEQSDEGKAQDAVAAVELVHPDDVRGNLTLPASGLHDTTFAWASSDPAVVTTPAWSPARRTARSRSTSR